MNYTEKQHCDKCGKTTSHQITDNQCVPCAWKDNDDYWKEESKKSDFEARKNEERTKYQKLLNSEENKQFVEELTDEEKEKYKKVVERRNNLFSDKKQNSSDNNKDLGKGQIALIVIFLVVVAGIIGFLLFKKKNKNH